MYIKHINKLNSNLQYFIIKNNCENSNARYYRSCNINFVDIVEHVKICLKN